MGERVKDLQMQLKNNKIFMNMVIHDMRNLTNSIEFALKEVLRHLHLVVAGTNQQSMPSNASHSGFVLQVTRNFKRLADLNEEIASATL